MKGMLFKLEGFIFKSHTFILHPSAFILALGQRGFTRMASKLCSQNQKELIKICDA